MDQTLNKATGTLLTRESKLKKMAVTDNIKKLMDAGVHFGHLTRKWNPNMAPYIFMERNGIHVIDLHKTEAKMTEATEALQKIAASGRKILFVATKKTSKRNRSKICRRSKHALRN